MSRNIAIADDVYELLSQRKGTRSFSEAIRDALSSAPQVRDLVGRGALDARRMAAGRKELEDAGRKTMGRMRGAA